VAGLAGIDVDAARYRLHWWKGSYFAVSGKKARTVSRLVYPVPTHVSLGVHAVLGLDGRLRFGPDADYLPERVLDHRVDEAKRGAFGTAVRRLFPQIADEDLSPDVAGIRPKLQAPGDGFRDFVVAGGCAVCEGPMTVRAAPGSVRGYCGRCGWISRPLVWQQGDRAVVAYPPLASA
jgi:L-2-hydroxyglutarate oxidase LhgO